MIRWLGRVLLLRVLPRRLLPILTVVEVAQLVRSLRRRRASSATTRRPTCDRWSDAFEAHHARSAPEARD